MKSEHFTQIWKKFFYERQIQLLSTEKKKNNQDQRKLFVAKQKQREVKEYKFILDRG